LALVAAIVACDEAAPRYTTPMQLSLLDRFEVAERSGPSARMVAPARSEHNAIAQDCNSSIVYHFAMPEAARFVGRGSIERSAGQDAARLAIGVTDEAGEHRTIFERNLGESAEDFAIDRALDTSWRDMKRIDLSFTCEVSGGPRIRWSELAIRGTQPTPPAPPAIARDHYNVLIILLDSLRADHIEPGGETRVATPRLQRLADEGITFRGARSTASWTRPAVASLLTSLYALNHGVLSITSRLPKKVPFLASILKKNGYQTILITNNVMVSPTYGFGRGFTRVFKEFHLGGGSIDAPGTEQRRYRDPEQHAHEIWSKYIASAAAAATEKPFFVYLHERDPHLPYSPPSPYDAMYASSYEGNASSVPVRIGMLRYRPELAEPALIDHFDGLYSGEVSYMDRYVGTLLDHLEMAGLERKTLVVFISDHGEEFWEHESVGHGHSVYDELLRVPLILRLEGVLPEGLVSDVPVDLADVAPSILDLLGIDPPPSAQGTSVLPYAIPPTAGAEREGTTAAVPVREHFSAAQANAPDTATQPVATSIVYGNWKLIHTAAEGRSVDRRLFDLATDPGEHSDIADTQAVVVGTLDQMRRWMRRDFDASRPRPEDTVDLSTLDSEGEANLRALGYID
jgi:arylsulfatase A-like enzyme